MKNRTQILENKIERLESLAEATIMLMEVALAEGVNTLEAFTEIKALDSTLDHIDKSISMLEQELDDGTHYCREELEKENEELLALLEEQQDEIDDWYDYAKELEENIEDIKMFGEIEQRLKQELKLIEEAEESAMRTKKKLCFIQFKDMLKKNPNIKNHVAAKELGVTEETIIKLKCMLQG